MSRPLKLKPALRNSTSVSASCGCRIFFAASVEYTGSKVPVPGSLPGFSLKLMTCAISSARSVPLTWSRPLKTTSLLVAGLMTFSTISSAADFGMLDCVTSASTWTVRSLFSQYSRTRASTRSRFTVWPGLSATTFGLPFSVMETCAFSGSRVSSSVTRRRVVASGPSWNWETMPTSRVWKKLRIRVIGFSGCWPAWSTVLDQSTCRPESRGSTMLDMLPALTVTGRRTTSPRLLTRRCSAWSFGNPPMSTPPTVTPRGTFPSLMA